MNNTFEKPKIEEKETPQQKKLREQKEQIAETKKFKSLCIDYHNRNNSEWNMTSYKKDSELYKKFLKVDVAKLPAALKPVYLHRLAYVQAIAQLGKNERIKAFAIKFMGITESDLAGKFDLLYKKVNGSAEFKALTQNDFKDALKALKGSISLLSKLPAGGTWKAEATTLLKPDRVDDDVASGRLAKAFKLMENNTKKLQRRKVTA